MRDSLSHCVPILAGMMGFKNPFLKGMRSIIENQITDFNNRSIDQIFLNSFLYPKIFNRCMEHCDYKELKYYNELQKFKIPIGEGELHVGGDHRIN